MTNSPTNAATAEVTAIDTQARTPLLLLIGSAVGWLVVSGILALITSIQLHTPAFLADNSWLTVGRAQAMRESAFLYGWAGNAGLAIALWVLGRLGGYPLRGLNWTVVGALFWNLGVLAGLVGIGLGDMTSFGWLQMPRYVQPLLAFAYAAMAIPGVLAWSGRRSERMYASQWYAVAALFLFPWLLSAAQIVLLWTPVRGVAQAVAAGWYAQGAWTLWLAPIALAAAYYLVPKLTGRVVPAYESAPLGFWTLIFTGAWTGGRHLIGGPVPAWVPTMAVAAAALLLFHYFVIVLNLRIALKAQGSAAKFVRFGVLAYLIVGLAETITSFRSVAEEAQFTFLQQAIEQLGIYGGVSMIFFGAIYYLLPRVTGTAWASSGLVSGHRVLVMGAVLASVIALGVAGISQGAALLDPAVGYAEIFSRVRVPLLVNTFAQTVALAANLLLLVNFCRTACTRATADMPAPSLFRQPSRVEASAS